MGYSSRTQTGTRGSRPLPRKSRTGLQTAARPRRPDWAGAWAMGPGKNGSPGRLPQDSRLAPSLGEGEVLHFVLNLLFLWLL